MAKGTVSDIDGDDTVMDGPDATVSIDLSKLPPQQALAIARKAGIEAQDPYVVGKLMQGEVNETDMDHLESAEFHLPLGPALTVLSQLGVIELPEQPPEEAAPPTDPEDVE